jgi:hypothetical protein
MIDEDHPKQYQSDNLQVNYKITAYFVDPEGQKQNILNPDLVKWNLQIHPRCQVHFTCGVEGSERSFAHHSGGEAGREVRKL